MTRREAVLKVFQKKNGSEADIISIIGEDYFLEFCLIGLIKRGVAFTEDNSVNTWAMTDALREEYDFFYQAPGAREREIARRYKQRLATV